MSATQYLIENLAASLYFFIIDPWIQIGKFLAFLVHAAPAKMWSVTAASPTSQSSSRESRIEKIEASTKHAVLIKTDLTDENLQKCNLQEQSPLYRLPKELRDTIWEFACSESTDPDYKYDPNAWYYRPDLTGRQKTYTNLLLCCRRIWLEANRLPMTQAEHVFWFLRGPYDVHPDPGWHANLRNEKERYWRLLQGLRTSSLRNLTHIHLFMQMFQAEQFVQIERAAMFFPWTELKRGLNPKVVQITLRSSDWTDWELDAPLKLDDAWVQAILDSPHLGGIEELRLNLETTDAKKAELLLIVERLKQLEGKKRLVNPTDPDCRLVSRFLLKDDPKTWQWFRSTKLNNKSWPVYDGAETLNLHVTVLTWRASEYSPSDETMKLIAPPVDHSHPSFQHPHPNVNIFGTPMLARRARRSIRFRREGFHSLELPHQEVDTWQNSVQLAEAVEDGRRDRFERMVGDQEARTLLKEWHATGSLLGFENFDAED